MLFDRESRKKYAVILGICFLTGSLCACVKLADRPEDNVLGVDQLAETAVSGQSGTLEVLPRPLPTAEPTPEPTPEPPPAPEVITITISAVGDVTLGNYPEQGYSLSLPETYEMAGDAGYFFENVYDIFSQDDMTIVNLEGGFTDSEDRREGQIYSIKGKPEYVKALPAGSIEAVSMGNNHRLDYKEQGSNDTVALLKEENIVYAYDENIGIYETKGIRIGFVSVNEFSEGYIVEEDLKDGIRRLQEEDVDLILACCHWGVEHEYAAEDYQKALGRKCIDWGADLVIGHHPHVLQGIDSYQGKYIIYSLGNFCFGANKNPKDKDTMIFQQTFTFVDGEKKEDADIRVIPCSISSVKERNDFKPTPAKGEDAERILGRINEFSLEFGLQFDENGRVSSVAVE